MADHKGPQFQDDQWRQSNSGMKVDDIYWFQVVSAVLSGMYANPRTVNFDADTSAAHVEEAAAIADKVLEVRKSQAPL